MVWRRVHIISIFRIAVQRWFALLVLCAVVVERSRQERRCLWHGIKLELGERPAHLAPLAVAQLLVASRLLHRREEG